MKSKSIFCEIGCIGCPLQEDCTDFIEILGYEFIAVFGSVERVLKILESVTLEEKRNMD